MIIKIYHCTCTSDNDTDSANFLSASKQEVEMFMRENFYDSVDTPATPTREQVLAMSDEDFSNFMAGAIEKDHRIEDSDFELGNYVQLDFGNRVCFMSIGYEEVQASYTELLTEMEKQLEADVLKIIEEQGEDVDTPQYKGKAIEFDYVDNHTFIIKDGKPAVIYREEYDNSGSLWEDIHFGLADVAGWVEDMTKEKEELNRYQMGWSQADGGWMVCYAHTLEEAEEMFEDGDYVIEHEE